MQNAELKNFFRAVILYSSFCILNLISCSSETPNKNTAPLFDLKKYFEGQAAALKESNPTVQKMVIQNGQAEKRDVQVEDWNTELKPFLETDISKPALRNS